MEHFILVLNNLNLAGKECILHPILQWLSDFQQTPTKTQGDQESALYVLGK